MLGLFLSLSLSFFSFSGFSLVAASGDYSLVAVHGLLIEEASLAAEHGL